MSNDQEKNLNIQCRLTLDPEYIEKAKQSICKDCLNRIRFDGEYFLCALSGVRVEYKREGVFHTQIVECDCFMRDE